MHELIHPAERLVAAMTRIYRYWLTTTSGGNLSIRDADGSVWITPARVDKGALRPEDIVRVLPDKTIEGRHHPSSEYPFHRKIYEVRADLGAIVHAHPVNLVAFSICGQTPDTRLFVQSHNVCGKAGFAPYALPGSEKLGERIAAVFAVGHDCVMLENHGVVVGGRDFEEAFRRFEMMEFVAKTISKAGTLGPVRYLTPAQLALAEKPHKPMEEFEAEPASSTELALRKELSDFIRRGYQQHLMLSAAGSFSARVDDDSFLISCDHADRATITPEQMVLIRNGRCQAGKLPNRTCELHRAIYARHPGIHAIVNASPVNATAFSVSATKLDTRTIPESYIYLREVKVMPFAWFHEAPEKIAETLTAKFPVALVENEGAMVMGKSILDAFDRLEVLESTAEAVILSASIGKVKPMTEAVIMELDTTFMF